MKVTSIDNADRVFRTQFRTFKQIRRFFLTRTSTKSAPKFPGSPKGAGVQPLFDSLSSMFQAAPGRSTPHEWNPLNQSPPLNLAGEFEAVQNPSFRELEDLVLSFVRTTHEMSHVLAWEPFFSGQFTINSEREFLDYSMAAEAYSFFHTDILVAPHVRTMFPDAEPILHSRSATNLGFNARLAFRALGVRKPTDILQIYLDAYDRRPTVLNSNNGVRAEELGAQIFRFRSTSIAHTNRFYRELKKLGVFTNFFQRFCKISGLPTLISGAPAAGFNVPASSDSVGIFFQWLATQGLKNLEMKPRHSIEAVKERRGLQTRAYFAMQLRHVLLNENFTGKALNTTERKTLVQEIDSYLDAMETALIELGRGVSLMKIRNLQLKADRRFEAEVRSKFRTNDMWMSKRNMIHRPRISLTFTEHQVDSRALDLKTFDVRRSLMILITAKRVDFSEFKTIKSQSLLLKSIREILEFENRLGSNNRRLKPIELKQFRKIMESKINIQIWSAPLTDINPLANRFRELTFLYE